MRTTVTDNLAHAIANELLINRDVAQMKSASGSADLAARVGQNPAAAMAELTGSLSNFGAVLTSPIMGQAAKGLNALANEIASATKQFSDFSTKHPLEATAVSGTAVAGATAGGLWLTGKLFGLVKGWLGLGGGSGGAASSPATATAGGGLLSRLGLGVLAGANLPGLINLATDDNRTPGAKANDAAIMAALAAGWKNMFSSDRPYGPQLPPDWSPHPSHAWTPSGVSLSGGADNAKLAAASSMPVNVQGQAELQQTLNITIQLDPEIRAQIMAARSASVTIPLIGGGSGRMDSDAGPHRSGIGSM
jgi:hypothetical protein